MPFQEADCEGKEGSPWERMLRQGLLVISVGEPGECLNEDVKDCLEDVVKHLREGSQGQ